MSHLGRRRSAGQFRAANAGPGRFALRATPQSVLINMNRSQTVLLLASWALAGLAFAQTSPSTAPDLPAGKPSKTAALEAELIVLERGTWEAAQRHDAKAFAAVCLDDCVEIWGDGSVLPIKEVLAQLPDTVITEYKIEDIAVSFPIEKTALVRYKVWAKTSYKGQESLPQWMHATAVWVNQDGAWKTALYQETPLPPK